MQLKASMGHKTGLNYRGTAPSLVKVNRNYWIQLLPWWEPSVTLLLAREDEHVHRKQGWLEAPGLLQSFASSQFLLTIAGQAPRFQTGRKSPIISLSHQNNVVQAPSKFHFRSRIRRLLLPCCAWFLPTYHTSLKDPSGKSSKAALGHCWFPCSPTH